MPSHQSHEEFRAVLEPFRRELEVHCYRMLGALEDAEDAAQESLLRAWSGFSSFEGRSSLRTWLYTIATTTASTAGARPEGARTRPGTCPT